MCSAKRHRNSLRARFRVNPLRIDPCHPPLNGLCLSGAGGRFGRIRLCHQEVMGSIYITQEEKLVVRRRRNRRRAIGT